MRKGITLIEIIIVSMIAAVVGVGTVSVIANANKVSIESARKMMLNSNVQRLMSEISRDVKGGAILAGNENKLVIVNADKSVITWVVEEDAVTRQVDGEGSDFLFVGVESVEFGSREKTFTTDNVDTYWKVKINFDISINEASGSLSIPAITNTYYCRTNPSGVDWGTTSSN